MQDAIFVDCCKSVQKFIDLSSLDYNVPMQSQASDYDDAAAPTSAFKIISYPFSGKCLQSKYGLKTNKVWLLQEPMS